MRKDHIFSFSHHSLLCFCFSCFFFFEFFAFFFFFWPVSFAAVAFLCQCALFVSHFPTLQTLSLSLCVLCVYAVL